MLLYSLQFGALCFFMGSINEICIACFKDVKEFIAELNAAKSRQADSIFYKRTDTTSAEQYFQAGSLWKNSVCFADFMMNFISLIKYLIYFYFIVQIEC